MAQHETMDESPDGQLVQTHALVLVGLGHGERVSKNQEKTLCSLQGLFRVGRASRKCCHSTFTLARGAGLRGLSRSGDRGQVEDVTL